MIFPREKKLTISNYFFVYFSCHLLPGCSVPGLSLTKSLLLCLLTTCKFENVFILFWYSYWHVLILNSLLCCSQTWSMKSCPKPIMIFQILFEFPYWKCLFQYSYSFTFFLCHCAHMEKNNNFKTCSSPCLNRVLLILFYVILLALHSFILMTWCI